MITKKRIEIKKAIKEWKKTMKKTYPGFNVKLWDSNATYRFEHPQPILRPKFN